MIASSISDAAALAGLPAPVLLEPAEVALVRGAQGGCSDSFRRIVESHQERVYHFCFQYLRDSGDAREACQDTFIRAHGALGSFKPQAKLGTWLFQIALNLCRDCARTRARRGLTGSLDAQASELPCGKATPEEAAMRHADLVKLDRGLAVLPEKLREILILSCLEGLSHAECAVILKCSERAVEGRLYRARERLAAWWERVP